MLSDRHIAKLIDWQDSRGAFPGVVIAGGICIFVWSRKHNGSCRCGTHKGDQVLESETILDEWDVFIRDPRARRILRKIQSEHEPTVAARVCLYDLFGLQSYVRPITSVADNAEYVTIKTSGGTGPFPLSTVKRGAELIDKHKVFTGHSTMEAGFQANKHGKYYIFNPGRLQPNTVCTKSYLVVGVFDDGSEADNYWSYLKTKFARFLVFLRISGIAISRDRFVFVPDQEYTHAWSDDMLYQKYGLDAEDITVIESYIEDLA